MTGLRRPALVEFLGTFARGPGDPPRPMLSAGDVLSRFLEVCMRKLLLVALLLPMVAHAEVTQLATAAFRVHHQITVPGEPEVIYDALTGDISGWWDHTFSGDPLELFIEPRPGGGFYEIFNAEGDGVLHATVIYAERGKRLTLRGPLGFSGNAIDIVCSYELEPVEGGFTKVAVTARAAGQFEEGWDEAVNAVWKHFLVDQFQDYVLAGKHLE